MKVKFAIATGIIVFFACCKKSPSTPPVNVSSGYPNTIVITDNGATDTAVGYFPSSIYGTSNINIIEAGISKGTSGSLLQIAMYNYVSGTINPFIISFQGYGPLGGLGVFTSGISDTATNYFTEEYSNGESYSIDSAAFNITTAYNNTVGGTFQLWVKNISSSKIITGTLVCNEAVVQ